MEKNVLHGGDIEAPIPVTLGELVLLLLRSQEDKVLQIDPTTGQELRASTLVKRAIRLARWLQSRGISHGDVISVTSENRIEFCLVPIAAFLIGVTIAPLNAEYTIAEFQHALKLSKPKIIFCSPYVLNKVISLTGTNPFVKEIVVFGRDPVKPHGNVVALERILEQHFLTELEEEEFIPPEVDTKETIATILCSSGTTGMPKGVMATQHNMTTFLSILRQITSYDLEETTVDVALGLVPFFHSMGFMTMFLTLMGGRRLIIIKKFNIKNFLQIIQDYKVTLLAVPPPIIVLLCQYPHLNDYDLSSIKEVRCGAAPLAMEFEKKIAKKLKISSVKQAYGMTETTLGVLFAPENQMKLGSVGKVVPGMMGKVTDENGNALGARKEGELCFKGPLIMKGYVGDPVATANTIDKDGWLHTGDVGYYDEDGFFFIVDRLKELIKYKAYQVPPAELEAILMSHPDILDAAVVGLPNEQAGELPLGYVVLKPGAKTTPLAIQNFVKNKVSPPKQLRGGVRFIESIPRNPTGKILRRVLKKKAIETKSKL